jgi:hypothetical protein
MQMVKDPFNSQKHIPCKDVLSNTVTNNLEMIHIPNKVCQVLHELYRSDLNYEHLTKVRPYYQST